MRRQTAFLLVLGATACSAGSGPHPSGSPTDLKAPTGKVLTLSAKSMRCPVLDDTKALVLLGPSRLTDPVRVFVQEDGTCSFWTDPGQLSLLTLSDSNDPSLRGAFDEGSPISLPGFADGSVHATGATLFYRKGARSLEVDDTLEGGLKPGPRATAILKASVAVHG